MASLAVAFKLFFMQQPLPVTSPLRVLLVEDDVKMSDLIREVLGREGMDADPVYDGENGLARAQSGQYALVLLDVMLPGIGGLEVLRRLRSSGTLGARLPVLMLTARGDELDKVLGLEMGADDYLPKPFNPRELAARLRAILRRAHGGPNEAAPREKFEVGDVELNLAARTLRRGGEKVELTGLEFDLMTAFLREAGRVVPREQIFRDVFGRKLLPGDRSIDTHVSNLRRKLGSHPDGSDRFKNLRGVGYGYTLPEE